MPDHYTRLADWLAGTIAQWNRSQNEPLDEDSKYGRMILNVISDSNNAIFLRMKVDTAGVSVTRLLVSRGGN
jgi:hypothetical protein